MSDFCKAEMNTNCRHDSIVFVVTIRAFDWLDERRGGKRLTKLPARQFIDTALTYIQKQLQDESLFPTKFGMFI